MHAYCLIMVTGMPPGMAILEIYLRLNGDSLLPPYFAAEGLIEFMAPTKKILSKESLFFFKEIYLFLCV